MNVWLSTTKTLRGAIVGMVVHITFNVDICKKIANNFDEKNTTQMFSILACPTIVRSSISIRPLKRSSRTLPNTLKVQKGAIRRIEGKGLK